MSKKIHIELSSNFGMISKNTADAAMRLVRRYDKNSVEYMKGGWDGRIYHLYMIVEKDVRDVNSLLTGFIARYDFLKFNLTVKK